MQYALKIKANPTNPAYDSVFKPRYIEKYANRLKTIKPFGMRSNTFLNNCSINTTKIIENIIPEYPVWNSKPIAVNFDLSVYEK